jgi:hypothetical protein
MHGHHRVARLAQRLQHRDDGPLRLRVHALERLVHQVDPGILHQRTRQEDALLLAARQLADLAGREVHHVHLLQRRQRQLTLTPTDPPEPAQRAVTAHLHHVQHRRREVPVHRAALRHVRHQPPLLFIRTAVDQDLARRRLQQPQHRLDERGLARAVRTDNAMSTPAGTSRSTSHSTGCSRYATVRSLISMAAPFVTALPSSPLSTRRSARSQSSPRCA